MADCGSFEVAVVGAGHAGCEAALAAARCGARTALITLNRRLAACMPCNPSVGGIAKSHLVYELDALGGEMGRNADYTGIHFRTLNTRRGPAVQSTRVQCDKERYSARMAEILRSQINLTVLEAEVAEIGVDCEKVQNVRLGDSRTIAADCLILTPGTALRGRIHIGCESYPGGGNGARSADRLAACLAEVGFRMGRLKTGTPPRLRQDTIDFSAMTPQPGDSPPPLFSWKARREREMFHVEQPSFERSSAHLFHVEQCRTLEHWTPGHHQVTCYVTHTTEATHDLIRANLQRSSLYGGYIKGTGVRYCPSVEDKIVKFPDKSSHHVFIEPEGLLSELVYPNGISNSLPADVQNDLVHSIPGLEAALLVRHGFAIEYDFCDPTQLRHSLETKLIDGLFLAGQINGTTGYEEAAAQGFVAGVNAARKVQGRAPIIFGRTESYIGVLIDDLVTKGTDEPYRMFTSRAERRLLLRQDNTRYRMVNKAAEIGIVDSGHVDETRRFESLIVDEIARLAQVRDGGNTLERVLRRPEVRYRQLPTARSDLHPDVVQQIEIRVKYDGYIQREMQEAARAGKLQSTRIPPSVNYASISALRLEAREKLARIQPVSLGQAARIPGITPADISILAVRVKALG